MSKALQGVRVAITENRYPEQLTQLLERTGAEVYVCPLLRETPLEDAQGARRFMEICETSHVDYLVFYTGVGVDFLLRAVNKPELLAKSRILARGPKAVNALKRAGVRVDLVADAPTTQGIIQTLLREDLNGKSVLVQLYGGQDNPELVAELESRGAKVTGISIYEYTQASNIEAISELLAKILDGEIHAITFTSATQVPFFLQAAADRGLEDKLRERLRDRVVVVSVGEVTSRALTDAGIDVHVMPEEPKMGPMVKALAEFFEKRAGECSIPSS